MFYKHLNRRLIRMQILRILFANYDIVTLKTEQEKVVMPPIRHLYAGSHMGEGGLVIKRIGNRIYI